MSKLKIIQQQMQVQEAYAAFKLRPYQSDIVKQATDARGSVLIEAPTGAGKSVMAKEIIRNETSAGAQF